MIHETEFDSSGAAAADIPGRRITTVTPQQCWLALDAAREQAFTGEIVFAAQPELRVYFDNGVAYYAERADDATLGCRLLEAQVIDAVQLERGTVRVGGVEHLGRLFDRDPSVDRDAVMVITEDATEALLADLANNVIASSQATAYRHHESGVHRWFVAPTSTAPMTRPVSDVAPVDNSVVEDLPGLPSAETGSLGDELRIEWVEPLAETEPPTPAAGANGADFDHSFLATGTDDAIPEIVESPFRARSDEPTPATEEPFAPPVVDRSIDREGDALPAAAPIGEAQRDASDSAPVADPEDAAAEQPPTGFESLVIDLDALTAPVEDSFQPTEESHDAHADAVIEPHEAVAPAEVIVPMDDEFLIVWPDGSEEAPAASISETLDRPAEEAPIAGEVLLPRRPAEPAAPSDEAIAQVEPSDIETSTDADAITAPSIEDSPELSPPEPMVESESVFEPESPEPLAEPESVLESLSPEPLGELGPAVEPESPEPLAEPESVLESLSPEPLGELEPAVEPESPEPLAELGPVLESLSPEPLAELEWSSSEPVIEFESESVVEPSSSELTAAPEPAAPEVGTEAPTVDPQAAALDPAAAPARIDFDVPALALGDLPSADGAVPDEVSSAVLRAIRAIENASTAAPVVAPIVGSGAGTDRAQAPPATEPDPAPTPMGFAPPTLETSAEAIYAARADTSDAEQDVDGAAGARNTVDVDTPGPRVASVVFVDDEDKAEPEDRAGALRRLISSLRRR